MAILPSITSQKAKIFMNGRSQAVRLPAAFRFDTDEVYIYRDEETGDVILSKKPVTWDGFLQLLAAYQAPEDFLSAEERAQDTTIRDPFGDLDDE